MYTTKALIFLPFLALANAAITILSPVSNTIWYTNDTVTLNWTISDPSTDTYLFRAFLSNQDQSLLAGNASIADSTNATAMFVRILLPQLQPGKGYLVNFVNTTAESQVFATSQAFEIQQGQLNNSSSTSGSASASSTTSMGGIPNAISTTAVSFPSATSSRSSAPSSRAFDASPLIRAGTILALIGAGMGLIL